MKSRHFPPSNHSKRPREGPGMVTGVLIIPHRALGSVGVVVPNYVDVVSTSASSGIGCRMEIRGNSTSFEDLIRVVEAATEGRFSFIPTGQYEGAIRGELADEVGKDSVIDSTEAGSSSVTSVAKEHSRTMLVEDAIYWSNNSQYRGMNDTGRAGQEREDEEADKDDEEKRTATNIVQKGADGSDADEDERRRQQRSEILCSNKSKEDETKSVPDCGLPSLASPAEAGMKQVPEETDAQTKAREKHNRLTVFRKVLTRHGTYQAKVLARKER